MKLTPYERHLKDEAKRKRREGQAIGRELEETIGTLMMNTGVRLEDLEMRSSLPLPARIKTINTRYGEISYCYDPEMRPGVYMVAEKEKGVLPNGDTVEGRESSGEQGADIPKL